MNRRVIEVLVGAFISLAMVGLLILALKVSGFAPVAPEDYYKVTAEFSNIGGLKERSIVSMAGVKIGEVHRIQLDSDNYHARVTMLISKYLKNIPTDSSASILTQGILGANYISISPGFDETFLVNGATITTTHSAMVLENIIGSLIYNIKDEKK